MADSRHPAEQPSQGPTSLPETSQPPSLVQDLLMGLSAPLAAPKPSFRPSSASRLTVSSDPALLTNLLQLAVERSGLKQAELARMLDIRPQSLNQYLTSRRSNPSAIWLAHFAEALGARLIIEFPSSR